MYGAAAGIELQMDRQIFASFQRLPGVTSSFSGLDTFMGRDEKIDFEDVLNRKLHRFVNRTRHLRFFRTGPGANQSNAVGALCNGGKA